MKKLALAAVVAVLAFGPVHAENITGPVLARVVDVYDGDTAKVIAEPWPGVEIRVSVRLRGIDAPEIRGQCDYEKALAVKARDRLIELIGDSVLLYDIGPDKYSGRVDADVWAGDVHPAAILVKEGLAREWTGRRESWCK